MLDLDIEVKRPDLLRYRRLRARQVEPLFGLNATIGMIVNTNRWLLKEWSYGEPIRRAEPDR